MDLRVSDEDFFTDEDTCDDPNHNYAECDYPCPTCGYAPHISVESKERNGYECVYCSKDMNNG